MGGMCNKENMKTINCQNKAQEQEGVENIMTDYLESMKAIHQKALQDIQRKHGASVISKQACVTLNSNQSMMKLHWERMAKIKREDELSSVRASPLFQESESQQGSPSFSAMELSESRQPSPSLTSLTSAMAPLLPVIVKSESQQSSPIYTALEDPKHLLLAIERETEVDTQTDFTLSGSESEFFSSSASASESESRLNSPQLTYTDAPASLPSAHSSACPSPVSFTTNARMNPFTAISTPAYAQERCRFLKSQIQNTDNWTVSPSPLPSLPVPQQQTQVQMAPSSPPSPPRSSHDEAESDGILTHMSSRPRNIPASAFTPVKSLTFNNMQLANNTQTPGPALTILTEATHTLVQEQAQQQQEPLTFTSTSRHNVSYGQSICKLNISNVTVEQNDYDFNDVDDNDTDVTLDINNSTFSFTAGADGDIEDADVTERNHLCEQIRQQLEQMKRVSSVSPFECTEHAIASTHEEEEDCDRVDSFTIPTIFKHQQETIASAFNDTEEGEGGDADAEFFGMSLMPLNLMLPEEFQGGHAGDGASSNSNSDDDSFDMLDAEEEALMAQIDTVLESNEVSLSPNEPLEWTRKDRAFYKKMIRNTRI